MIHHDAQWLFQRLLSRVAAAIDPSEWLLVEQNLEAHLCSLSVHDLRALVARHQFPTNMA